MTRLAILAAVVALVGIGQAQAAVVIHTTDFIANGARDAFNGFEAYGSYPGAFGPPLHSEGGLTVEQVNTDVDGIWTAFTAFYGKEGNNGWYPNSGDFGYTRITRTGGGTMQAIGMFVGDGGSNGFLVFDLLLGGATVGTGVTLHPNFGHYIGLSGVTFDTLRLRSAAQSTNTVTDGGFNVMTIDSIEALFTYNDPGAVPTPALGALLALAAVWLTNRQR